MIDMPEGGGALADAIPFNWLGIADLAGPLRVLSFRSRHSAIRVRGASSPKFAQAGLSPHIVLMMEP